MIVLTSAEARRARGRSPRDPRVAIEPVPLRNGSWILPESVLEEAANGDIADWLSKRPCVKRIPRRLFFDGTQRHDAMVLAVKRRFAAAHRGLL